MFPLSPFIPADTYRLHPVRFVSPRSYWRYSICLRAQAPWRRTRYRKTG